MRPNVRNADTRWMSETDPAALEAALRETPRSRHLPPAQQGYAGQDQALPIGLGQTNSQPRTVRAMLSALDVRPGQQVLDVGSGSGWTTVLLARLVGPAGHVLGVERVPELTAWGRANVEAADVPWATVEQARPDVLGHPAYAPFDRILVSAGAVALPQELVDQLAPDGVMVIPVGGELWRVRPGHHPERLGRYAFVPLLGPSAQV